MIIVESKMVTGQIQLGANLKLLGNPLSGGQPGSFFYWRRRSKRTGQISVRGHVAGESFAEMRVKLIASGTASPARQHLILQTTRAVAQRTKAPEMSGNRGRSIGTQSTAIDGGCGGSNPTCSNFYDNPSQKRVAECTNIPRTGALPTVKGVGQRLRKGFQKLDVVSIRNKALFWWTPIRKFWSSYPIVRKMRVRFPFQPESLSSAAKIRHSARNTRLWYKYLCLACTHR